MIDRLSDAQLEALASLCERATPGPWTREKPGKDADGFQLGVAVAATYGRQMIYATPPGGQSPSADCDFIAAARAALPALIAEVQAHRAAKAAEHASAEALAGMMPLGGGEP